MAMNPEGYHAFLLVVKFGNRFTGEEQRTITFLKHAFGDTFVKDYCILIMSGGDMFKENVKSEGMSFKEWCKLQKGQFQELLNECNGRIVLFDNFTKDNNEKDKQLMKLIYKVNTLPKSGKRYTDENFQMARERREALRLEAKEPFIRQRTLDETGLIIGVLEKLQQSDENQRAKIESLYKLLNRDENLVKSIKEQDKNCTRFKDLVETAESLGSSISEEVKFANKRKEDEEMLQRRQAAIKQQEDELAFRRLEAEKIKEETKRLEWQREQMRLQAELDRAKREKEEQENRRMQELKDEQEKQRKITEDLENKYKEIKTEQNGNFAGQVFTNVAVPLWNYAKSWWWGS